MYFMFYLHFLCDINSSLIFMKHVSQGKQLRDGSGVLVDGKVRLGQVYWKVVRLGKFRCVSMSRSSQVSLHQVRLQ